MLYAIELYKTRTTYTFNEIEKARINWGINHKREYPGFSRFQREGGLNRHQKIGMRCSRSPHHKPDQLQKMFTSTNTFRKGTPTPFVGRAITIAYVCHLRSKAHNGRRYIISAGAHCETIRRHHPHENAQSINQ